MTHSKYADYLRMKMAQAESFSEEEGVKETLRKELQSQMEAFYSSGGQITQCEPGETADPDTRVWIKRSDKNV
jgi:hypothetical protein